MIKRMKYIKIVLAFALILVMLPCNAFGDEMDLNSLMKGECIFPVQVSISSPTYKLIAPLSEERAESLNKLMKHLSLSVILDDRKSETTILVDNEPVYSYLQETDDSIVRTVYSIQPDNVYVHSETESETDSVFTEFLEAHFFSINAYLDELYPVFLKSAEIFKDYARSSSVSLNFSGYGKGVKRLTIPLPDQYVRDSFPGVVADMTETENSRNLIQRLYFSGSQKIILLYDQNDKLLRINYDGVVGISEDSMRKVSIVWRCVRSDNMIKDNLVLKTPAIKGYDKYNITYERVIDYSDPECHNINWNMQLDVREDKKKAKTAFNAQLVFKENNLSGKTVFSDKQEGNETKTIIVPSIEKENNDEYNGTIEITNYSGKIETSNTVYSVCVSPGKELKNIDYSATQETDNLYGNLSQEEELVVEQLAGILVRRLLVLPDEDIKFFSMDVPEDIWETLLQSLY